MIDGVSPVFDVNPNPDLARSRSTSIVGADALPEEVDGLLALAEYCSMSPDTARERIARVTASLHGWRDRARANRIAAREIAMMAESIGPRLDAVAGSGRGSA
ncbi:hypothetical protein [Pseudonocardia sp. KRD291]|uniref:hypothetical protein n=1 Tax=Pseudonocardia sp. KRD291 TaxID=2792007 RepID=UPI001C4A53DC|nr:hypothetical protein [Pseudonocardia sp. KRD291]MBW0101601.1 HipA domain-containing protein [Pseudonocardia sp. KRD291]